MDPIDESDDVTAPHVGVTLNRLCDELIANIEREYPNQITHVALGAAELQPPALRHPIFFGCYDWHSAVHSHWALLRLRRYGALRPRIDIALNRRAAPDAVAAEIAYLAPRPRFELPYGLAWLLCLCAEASRSGLLGEALRQGLAPLEALARQRLLDWVRALPAPVRTGEHGNSAFAMTLALDWARVVGDGDAVAVLLERALALHERDRDVPWAYEPSAHDFLSPALTGAWLMTRVLGEDFPAWLDRYAPYLGRGLELVPPVAVDRNDGKLVHWDGLALSRAWMLAEIARALPVGDPRVPPLFEQADDHGARGVAALEGATYAGMHWLPSFAIYWFGAKAGVDAFLT
jgi:hypothetical protein